MHTAHDVVGVRVAGVVRDQAFQRALYVHSFHADLRPRRCPGGPMAARCSGSRRRRAVLASSARPIAQQQFGTDAGGVEPVALWLSKRWRHTWRPSEPVGSLTASQNGFEGSLMVPGCCCRRSPRAKGEAANEQVAVEGRSRRPGHRMACKDDLRPVTVRPSRTWQRHCARRKIVRRDPGRCRC